MMICGSGASLRAAAAQRRGALEPRSQFVSSVRLLGARLPTVLTPGTIRTHAAAPSAENAAQEALLETDDTISTSAAVNTGVVSDLEARAAQRRLARQREQLTYQISAIAATIGITGLAVLATYLRFEWHVRDEGQMPWAELLGTLALVAGGAFGMEMYARFAHKSLWHDFEPGWALHKSHHMPRTGPFEANDIFAVINGLPAMALCLYGFLTPGMIGGMCFGSGLGITLFGIAYMFVHDGLVHRRFPVGPIAELPYLKRLAVAHQLHHAQKYGGAPWGMFLALQELDGIPGARDEVERMVSELDFSGRK